MHIMLIRNTVFVDYSAAFLQSKLSVGDECLLTESTNIPLMIKLLLLHRSMVIRVMVKPSGFNGPEADAVYPLG